MKTILRSSVPAILLMCCVLTSCSKQDDPSATLPANQQLKSTAVFTVAPSGNYEDDSQNIQDALNDAVAAGPGSTVKLTAGTFYLKYRIEIDGFDGYFKGAGKQKTIITTHDIIDYYSPPFTDNLCLITFRHGYVRMSDLTFNITETEPCYSDFENALPTVIMVAGSSSYSPPAGDQCGNSWFNNLEFIAGAGNWYGANVGGFIYIGADRTESIIGGNQKITKCLFQGSINSVTNWCDDNAVWIVGGNGASGNIFKGAYWPLTLGEFSNSTAEISYNTFEGFNWGAIFITQGFFSDYTTKALSTFLIEHNTIAITAAADGISIIDISNDEGYGKTIDAVIKNNQVSMDVEGFFGGIYGYAADDIIVKNNQVWGTGLAGIYSAVNGDYSSKWFLQGNNVQNVNGLAAPVWLGPGTSDYTVIGGPNATNVWDEGTNNILTGVNNVQGNNLGQQVQEAHDALKQMMLLFKNH